MNFFGRRGKVRDRSFRSWRNDSVFVVSLGGGVYWHAEDEFAVVKAATTLQGDSLLRCCCFHLSRYFNLKK